MDNKNKALLQRYKKDIIKDLDVAYIFDNLYSSNALSRYDSDYILKNVKKNREGTARYLVEKLIQSGSNSTFQIFVDSLAKDYYWLAEKFNIDTNNVSLNESLEDNLRKGDVPRLPEHHVRRIQLEKIVEEKLNNLSRHNFLVLHGTSGSGKTALAISVLRHNPDMVNTSFNSSVFWLRVDGCMTEDDIIAKQTKLYRKASACYSNNSYMNSTVSMSSIGSNGDNTSLSCYDWTVNDLTDRLKALFSQQGLADSLLVLDKVNDRKIVEAFDIGCKILVTTKDVDVVSEFHPEIVKIDDKFEENESLEVFASYLDTDTSQLPRQAKKLHELLKGNPYYIAFIGAQLAENKEKLMHRPKHWNYFVHYIEKKEFFFLPSNKSNPMKTVEMCINSLESEALNLFRMLAVLPDNVRVSAKMLARLWNKEIHEVDSIMKKFLRKALVYASYDKDQHNYTYEIHSLIMNFLRSVTNKEETKRLHTLILKNYNYDSQEVPVEIVDDGYIAFYIGYHISHTNMLGLFNKLYLDPRFLGNKARLTGPADVISDLNKYEMHIVVHELDRELLNNIKAYLSTHGVDLYRYPHTDIVQNILQNESKGILYSKAYEIAQKRIAKNEVYFEFLHEQNVEEIKPSSIDVKEVVWAVCFLGDYVLIGTSTGVIKVYHISANKLKKELQGSGSPIKWISACPLNPPMVATLDNNGYIMLWYLDDLVREPSEETIEEEPEDQFYKFASNITISPPLEPFINCRWAQYEEILVAHTSNVVKLYDPSGVFIDEIDSFDKNCNVVNCVPFYDDCGKYLIVALENTCNTIEVICRRSKRKLMCFEVVDSVINILTVPGSNTIIIHTEKEIVKNVIELKAGSYNCNVCKTKTVISGNDVKDNLKFISVAINNSGTLLFVSTDDSRIICIDLNTNAHLFDLENRRGNVVTMGVSEVWYDFMPGSDVLLTGTGTVENCAKIWYLDSAFVAQATQKNSKARLTTTFDVSFLRSVSPQTPGSSTPNNGVDCVINSPKRHQSFVNHKEMEKKVVKKTTSLDRHALKPLNLKGICNGNYVDTVHPLLAVVDDKNHIQILRGRKFLTEITEKSGEQITTVKISPCNQYIIYGLKSGSVKKYALRTKETKVIMEVYSPVEYMKFVSENMLVVAGKSCTLMAYCFSEEGGWEPLMLQRGNANLGSQEILNDIQGVKKKNGQPERLPSSGSDSSICSKDRMFPGTESKELCRRSGLVYSHWIPDLGLVTVERNATIKLWDRNNTTLVLQGRKTKAHVTCAVIRKHTLVVCDGNYKKFQTFELKLGERIELRTIQEYQLNNKIISCDLTADGFLLAMGLDSGDVVLWNVVGRRQLRLLKHHKSRVQWCSFSPVPSPSLYTAGAASTDNEPPLVLVTMAAEIVWWNISYLMRSRTNKNVIRTGMNVVSPLLSPVETRPETSPLIGEDPKSVTNYFFAGLVQDCWKTIWRGKTYKEGSMKKEILACIKLSGVNAKKLCHDDKLSCFVTVDNPGHIHIMNVMKKDT